MSDMTEYVAKMERLFLHWEGELDELHEPVRLFDSALSGREQRRAVVLEKYHVAKEKLRMLKAAGEVGWLEHKEDLTQSLRDFESFIQRSPRT